MKIAVGSDHAGIEAKQSTLQALGALGHETVDVGPSKVESVDYPDYASKVCAKVQTGEVDRGILICGTGIGMSIAANKFEGIRAALVTDAFTAKMARAHNDANVLCMGARVVDPKAIPELVKIFATEPFEGGRHQGRVEKLSALDRGQQELAERDPLIFKIVSKETERQLRHLEMIASENFVSDAVMEAAGSVLTNKYAEGYPGKRYYSGCEFVDQAEELAIERAKQLFGAQYVNVQPHSGSQANMAVYFSVLKPKDKILAMNLAHGGHLTHGSPVNFSGKLFEVVPYGVRKEDGRIDYDEVEALAREHKPKMIVCGASAYPRILDFERFRKIADSVDAFLMADVAHIAGLVVAGVHPNPMPHCHFVTTTTHKTLRGPRGGMIMSGEALSKKIASQIFPGIQGGPLMHIIAAKAVAFGEALTPEFREYAKQVVRNAQALATGLQKSGFELTSGGTDNHLMLVDLRNRGLTGKIAEAALERAGIAVNKNMVPFDTEAPMVTSGVRIGTPALTTRGMKEPEMQKIAAWIDRALTGSTQDHALDAIRDEVSAFCDHYPRFVI